MDGSEDDDAEEDDEKIDPAVIKMEILKKIDHAHNCAMITLDFISLLLTKEVPVQAGTTLTQGLREMVGIGTLGSTKMIESNVSAERIQDDNQVGLGWSLMDIDKVSLAAKQSAVTLKKEIEKENKYWESVISVSEAGWNVCRLPNERQTLGVKFGFTTGAVVKTLHNAGFPESRFIVIASPHKVDEAIHQVSKSERMSLPQVYISALLEPLSFHIRLSLTKSSRLLVGARTYLTPQTTTLYTVILNDTNLNHPNCLPDIFPPVMQYPTLADLRQLLALAMAYSVTKSCHDTLSHEEKEAKAAAQSTTVPTISAGTSMPSLTGSDDLPLPAYWTHALDNTMLLHRIDLSAGSEAKVSVSAKDIQGADGKFHPQLTVFANLDTPSPEEGSGGRDPDAGIYGADGDTDAKNVSAITTTTMEADDWVSVSVAKPKPLKQGIKTRAREDVIPFAKSVTMTWNEHGGAISDGLGIGGDAGTSGVLEACKKLVRELFREA
ncbi:Mediator of RNA polymerase II transcription subunit 17 [Ceratocystis platani]|uniref:Mediator of RNA polymerase II transcription subunit 17 n=1 Tax=Ceratocystis fimbriata f. sp. platani TaxID=88771 RepID=A0A0F8BML0_CERFI|nr:Mediator of RNA polymerase II transcription subunit 17 [Ceratocystis platani]